MIYRARDKHAGVFLSYDGPNKYGVFPSPYLGHWGPRKADRLCGERRSNGAGELRAMLARRSKAKFVTTRPEV